MAWRDSRRSRSRLLLFTASIVMGIAALVAINSFSDNLRNDIQNQAKNLLGADLVIQANKPYSDSLQQLIDSIGGERARETSFASMVYFPKTQGTRLIQVRALKGGYPFYGKLATEPPEAAATFQQGKNALVDQSLLIQYGVEVGDSVKIGRVTFLIAGKLMQIPGQNAVTSTVAPTVFIPRDYLEATGLVQKGSRINHAFYYKLPKGVDGEKLEEKIEGRLRRESLRSETVEDRKRRISRAFTNMERFLNLVSFVALLLGCVGVASAVHIYVKEKIPAVAVLRCLGARGSQAFFIYLLQISFMGLAGAIAGAALGVFIQRVLPAVLMDFLPFEATVSISWPSVAQGILTGLAIAVLFALLVLLPIRHISPLYTLRASFEHNGHRRDRLVWLMIGLIGLFVYGFAFWQMQRPLEALFFVLGIGAAFLVLAGVARLISWAVRRFFPANASYIWRQSLSNLYRPNNQTLVLMVCIGLGTALITQLFFIQDLLLSQVEMTGTGKQPNMVLFDIQNSQKEELASLTSQYELPLIQQVPIVSMRLASVKGRSRAEILNDTSRTSRRVARWAVNREYRATYRDSLIGSETIVAGKWVGRVQEGDSIFVSLEEEFGRDDLGVDLGDELVFDVQGRLIKTYVGSFRQIDFARFQTNFMVLFPAGVLENAPQFHVLITRTNGTETSAKFQRAVVQQFPNVSVIDLALVLNTIDDVIGKVSFVIRFMALFSIITGLIVLLGSVIISKYQRIQESVLLRTLGASRRQILRINMYEYLILGLLASVTGIILALLGSWATAIYSFEMVFVPKLWPPLLVIFIITGITVLLGMLNSRSIVNKPPLEVLRKEVG
ncbi:MAG: FtsX-like permease family protein [Bacteroidetes bacterium]|nr:MAG: FtsX-like permease family protein [Bacteroidota bacterium]